jgi:hypothetical protein
MYTAVKKQHLWKWDTPPKKKPTPIDVPSIALTPPPQAPQSRVQNDAVGVAPAALPAHATLPGSHSHLQTADRQPTPTDSEMIHDAASACQPPVILSNRMPFPGYLGPPTAPYDSKPYDHSPI